LVSSAIPLKERTKTLQERISNERALSVSQLAKRLYVCERTARRIIEAGELKAHRIGRQWRVFEPDLRDYLARQANRQVCRHYGERGDAP
jgi:excisionase family DNA binding protein